MIVGGVVAVVAIVGILIAVLSGGGSSKRTGQTAATTPAASAAASQSQAAATSPGVTRVAVLNGTSTVGLARRLATDLQQSGYRRAIFLTAHPPGVRTATTVEYATGHRADADAVARSLGVSSIQPLTASVRALAGSSPIIVIAGTDRATGAAAGVTPGTSTAGGTGAGTGSPSGTGSATGQ